jgi:hypothetical protein
MATPMTNKPYVACHQSHLLLRIAEIERRIFSSVQRREFDSFIASSTDRLRNGIRKVHSLQGVVHELVAKCMHSFGAEYVSYWESVALCRAMNESLGKLQHLQLPRIVLERIIDDFCDITDQIEKSMGKPLGFFDDPTLRIIKISLLRWLPAGMNYFEYSGIPRKNLWLCPIRDKMALAGYIMFRMKGLRPTIELHLPAQLDRRYTKTECEYSYRIVAEVLRMQPWVRGISGSSWLYDPAVGHISPHLAFARELPEFNGGFLHRLGYTNNADRKALLKSPTRRKCYEEGKYLPVDYARYWSRTDVLAWVAKCLKEMNWTNTSAPPSGAI